MHLHVFARECQVSLTVSHLLLTFMNLCLYLHARLCLCAQGSLLITSGFSLYLGNVFPVAMDYLRCAAGSVSDHRNHGHIR